MVTTAELKRLMTERKRFFLIDVREKNELKYGMLPAAVSVPLSELAQAVNLAPEEFKGKYHCEKFQKKDKVILYCRTGSRSEHAAKYLATLGYKAENYPGSIKEWSEHDTNVKMY